MSKKPRLIRVRDGWWHFRFTVDGREYSGSTGLAGTARNRKEAERVAARKRGELAAAAGRADVTFDAAAGEFLEWCREVGYRAKPNSAARIATSFASLRAALGPMRLADVTPADVEAYKAERLSVHQVRPITLRHDLHALSVFYQWAMQRELAAGNPVKAVTVPSDRDAVRYHRVTEKEEAAYFGAAARLFALHVKGHQGAQPNVADVARLMIEQGARPEEILAARVEHYDAGARTLRIAGGKTRAARRVLYLTRASVEILERRAALGGPWLFPSERNPGHHVTKLQGSHDRVCREAGVSFVLYDLRHNFATRMIEAGADLAAVAGILGHSNVATLARYVHPSAQGQKAAMVRYERARGRGRKGRAA